MGFLLLRPPWALGSGSDRRSHPAGSAGNECLAAGRGCQGAAGCGAGVGGRRWWRRAELHGFGATVEERKTRAASEKGSGFRASQGRRCDGEEQICLLKSFWLGQALGAAARFMPCAHAESLRSFSLLPAFPQLLQLCRAAPPEPGCPSGARLHPAPLGQGAGEAAASAWHPSLAALSGFLAPGSFTQGLLLCLTWRNLRENPAPAPLSEREPRWWGSGAG